MKGKRDIKISEKYKYTLQYKKLLKSNRKNLSGDKMNVVDNNSNMTQKLAALAASGNIKHNLFYWYHCNSQEFGNFLTLQSFQECFGNEQLEINVLLC